MSGVVCWHRDYIVKNEVSTMIDASHDNAAVAGTKRGSDLRWVPAKKNSIAKI